MASVREQVPVNVVHGSGSAYIEVEGRAGATPIPHHPRESGQGSPEPVRTTEVRRKCGNIPVISMAQRERYPAAEMSHTPRLCSPVEIPGCTTRAGITTEKVKPRASLLPDVISLPSLSGPRQDLCDNQAPDRIGPSCQGDDPQPVLRRPLPGRLVHEPCTIAKQRTARITPSGGMHVMGRRPLPSLDGPGQSPCSDSFLAFSTAR